MPAAAASGDAAAAAGIVRRRTRGFVFDPFTPDGDDGRAGLRGAGVVMPPPPVRGFRRPPRTRGTVGAVTVTRIRARRRRRPVPYYAA